MAGSQARCCRVFPPQIRCSFLWIETEIGKQNWITIRTLQDAYWEGCSNSSDARIELATCRLCLNKKQFGYIVLKPRPMLTALVPRFPPENVVNAWRTKCARRHEHDARQRPVCAACWRNRSHGTLDRRCARGSDVGAASHVISPCATHAYPSLALSGHLCHA